MCVHICMCTHMYVPVCVCVREFCFRIQCCSEAPIPVNLLVWFPADCAAVAMGTKTSAGSDSWLPILTPLAAVGGGDVNEGRTPVPTASCKLAGCGICGMKPTVRARGKSHTT